MSTASLEQLTRAERMLAAVETAGDAADAMALADFAADLARRVDLGTASVNHALAIKAKAMRKLADIVDEGHAKGEIATPANHGRGKQASPQRGEAPQPLPIPSQRLEATTSAGSS